MSTSELSFNFCFCRFDIIEKAMSRVSSGESRGASATGYNSPPIRITGKDPTFRCKSEAKCAVAVTSRSSILIGIEIRELSMISRKCSRGIRANRRVRAVGQLRRDQKHNSGLRKVQSTIFGLQRRGLKNSLALREDIHSCPPEPIYMTPLAQAGQPKGRGDSSRWSQTTGFTIQK